MTEIRLYKAVRSADHKELIIVREQKADGKVLLTGYVQVIQDLMSENMAELATFGAQEILNGRMPDASKQAQPKPVSQYVVEDTATKAKEKES